MVAESSHIPLQSSDDTKGKKKISTKKQDNGKMNKTWEVPNNCLKAMIPSASLKNPEVHQVYQRIYVHYVFMQ